MTAKLNDAESRIYIVVMMRKIKDHTRFIYMARYQSHHTHHNNRSHNQCLFPPFGEIHTVSAVLLMTVTNLQFLGHLINTFPRVIGQKYRVLRMSLCLTVIAIISQLHGNHFNLYVYNNMKAQFSIRNVGNLCICTFVVSEWVGGR